MRQDIPKLLTLSSSFRVHIIRLDPQALLVIDASWPWSTFWSSVGTNSGFPVRLSSKWCADDVNCDYNLAVIALCLAKQQPQLQHISTTNLKKMRQQSSELSEFECRCCSNDGCESISKRENVIHTAKILL